LPAFTPSVSSRLLLLEVISHNSHLIKVLAYAIAKMDGIRGYKGWRWIFILEGVITVAIGLFAPFFLIDFPDKAKFLKPDEKEHVLNRLNIERGDGETHNLSWKLLRHHLSDWTLWWVSLVYLCNVGPIYSLAYFVPTILNVFPHFLSYLILVAWVYSI
jgi:hypothetical protein